MINQMLLIWSRRFLVAVPSQQTTEHRSDVGAQSLCPHDRRWFPAQSRAAASDQRAHSARLLRRESGAYDVTRSRVARQQLSAVAE